MKKSFIAILTIAAIGLLVITGCDTQPSSDQIQQSRQEIILKEGAAQVGMPAIVNFREMKILKDIYELRDQEGIITYTYIENMIPTVIPGRTACGGKFSYIGQSIGYGIPAATQFTNPQKAEWHGTHGWVILPQADPNGIFSPSSAEGTWIMMLDADGKTRPQYIESRIAVFSAKLPFDK